MNTILLIEEEQDSLSLLKEILDECGYNTLGTKSMANALDVFKRGITVDLIICSIIVDNTERFDLIDQLKNERSSAGIPLIALISSAETTESAQAREKGCSGCIAKPIEEEKVVAAVRNAFKMGDNNGKDPSS